MDDYISRQTVMNAFAEYVRRSNNSDFAPTPTWNDAVEIVENLPSADVQPSKPGQLVGGVLERNIDNIRQAGLEGKEFRFRIGGVLDMIKITKTKEEAEAERYAKAERASKMLAEMVCPYCKKDSNVEYETEFASTQNLPIDMMCYFGLMKDKERRHYRCLKCGAEWVGEWYEC